MLNTLRGASALLVTLIVGAPSAGAQQDQPLGTIATVNGTEITGRDVALAAEANITQLQRLPAQLRLPWLVDRVIEQVLLSGAATEEGIEDSDAYRERLAYVTRQAKRDAYLETTLSDTITDADIEARYNTEVAGLPEEEEAVARHVLVETEEEAEEIARTARGGADFAALARERSTGPSAAEGGALDPFTADQMVPEFSAAAFALEIGEISDPVQSQFGWHVIKLEDKRKKPAPALDTVRDSIEVMILRDRLEARVKELRDAATIDYAEGTGLGEPPAGDGEAGSGAEGGEPAGAPAAE